MARISGLIEYSKWLRVEQVSTPGKPGPAICSRCSGVNFRDTNKYVESSLCTIPCIPRNILPRCHPDPIRRGWANVLNLKSAANAAVVTHRFRQEAPGPQDDDQKDFLTTAQYPTAAPSRRGSAAPSRSPVAGSMAIALTSPMCPTRWVAWPRAFKALSKLFGKVCSIKMRSGSHWWLKRRSLMSAWGSLPRRLQFQMLSIVDVILG